ncbi:hypothetical protein C8R44DRAFT_342424 [Mycena epipterygia]|nr:hypothetical protein C8R44DRAFT_342424 [Mycena epipterygia]
MSHAWMDELGCSLPPSLARSWILRGISSTLPSAPYSRARCISSKCTYIGTDKTPGKQRRAEATRPTASTSLQPTPSVKLCAFLG